MASDIFHSSLTKPILFFFFCIRKNPFHETHEEAQNPKSQNRASHPDNDHRNSKGPVIHLYRPPADSKKLTRFSYIIPKREFQGKSDFFNKVGLRIYLF
jgi:hypothetical protein